MGRNEGWNDGGQLGFSVHAGNEGNMEYVLTCALDFATILDS